jgi:hypothetical protein
VEDQYGGCVRGAGAHTAQMMPLEVINPGEASLTDITAKVLVCRLHDGPSERLRGSRRESGVR